MSKVNHYTLKEICDLISITFDVSTFFITPTGEIEFECTENRLLNPMYQNNKFNLFSLIEFEPSEQLYYPSIRETYFYENYVLISVMEENEFIGTVIIGPTFPYVVYDDKINGIINDLNIHSKKDQIYNYYHETTVIDRDKLFEVTSMCNYLINHSIISTETIKDNFFQERQDRHIHKEAGIRMTRMDYMRFSHHDPLMEKQLLSIIKEGRIEELRKFNFSGEEKVGVLSKSSQIRSKKNVGIAGITLATRAAIDGGLNPEIAFSLSDIYIQQLEDLFNLKDIDELLAKAIFTLTEKVNQIKNKRFSKTITDCKNYIYDNRFKKLNLEDIATTVNLSQSYLSTLFKKETGMTVSEYIQQVKIEEAKNFIKYTSTPLSEISSLLNFSDQSYFTKVFKKFTGLTPNQYKESFHLSKDNS